MQDAAHWVHECLPPFVWDYDPDLFAYEQSSKNAANGSHAYPHAGTCSKANASQAALITFKLFTGLKCCHLFWSMQVSPGLKFAFWRFWPAPI